MRIFRPTYRDRNGNTKKVKKWWIELRDHTGKVRRFAGCTDKRQSVRRGEKIERLIVCSLDNERPDRDLLEWLQSVESKLRNRLVGLGLIEAKRAIAPKPPLDYVDDFRKSIIPTKDNSGRHAKHIAARVRNIIKDCNFKTWADVSGAKIDQYVSSAYLSAQTKQAYVKVFRQFARWMVKNGNADKVPDIASVKVPKRFERAFELDEFSRLLKAARTGPDLFGMTGYQRYVVYILAVETGLRRGELRSITPPSFDFKSRTVFVKGEHTKNSDDAMQRFSVHTSRLLQDYIRGKMPNVQLFPVPHKSAIMIRHDCKAAGIETENHKGKLKFHTLRHTCGSFLAAKGVHPKVIQEIMRHKNIDLTMSRYTHTLRGQVEAAIARLPSFAATGTD